MTKVNAEDFSISKQNKTNFKKSIIQRSNLTNEFTLEDIENHLTELNRLEKELASQIKLSTAVVGNVERNHPFVSKMSDEALNAAAYLFETKKIISDSEKKLKSVKQTKKNYKEVIDTIYKKFGFVESNVL
jgi:paraquat-inducible protein B